MKTNRLKLGIGSVIVLTVLGLTGYAQSKTETEDQANAKKLLKAMSTYIGSQERLSFKLDSNLEVVTKDHQKLGVASSGALVLDRKKGLHASRRGGFANVEMFYDGQTVTFLDNETKSFAQIQFTGPVHDLIDELRFKHQMQIPAADLLRPDFYETIMASVTDVKDLGSGFIRGQECDHIALRTYDVDVEIWIAQGERPYPCRVSFVTTKTAQAPRYTVDVIDFKAGEDVENAQFDFIPPQGAQLVEKGELKGFDELPEHFKGQK